MEGDAFLVCFEKPATGLKWALEVQSELMKLAWPTELSKNGLEASETVIKGGSTVFQGLRVRMGCEVRQLVTPRSSPLP